MNLHPTTELNDLCKSVKRLNKWNKIKEGAEVGSIDVSWWRGLARPSTCERARTLLANSEFTGLMFLDRGASSVFRAAICASHSVEEYKAFVAVSDNKVDWGSYCTCPSGYVSIVFGSIAVVARSFAKLCTASGGLCAVIAL
jgi:hypothetical protein